MFRFIRRAIKEVFKFITPKPFWKRLRALYYLHDHMDYVRNSLDNIERAVHLTRHEANGQISFIYPNIKTEDGSDMYYGVSTFDIPRKIPLHTPGYPHDVISSVIEHLGQFFEQSALEELNPYIPQDAVILDIGANIGNHSVYWAVIRRASRILAFEPIKFTFHFLSENIKINGLDNIVTPINLALGDKKQAASITYLQYDDIGKTSLKYGPLEDRERDSIRVDLLDNVISEISPRPERIDLVKIDVEGFENFTLLGAKDTLSSYTPSIFIEAFPENYDKVCNILGGFGYVLVKDFGHNNYLFIHKKKLSKVSEDL